MPEVLQQASALLYAAVFVERPKRPGM